MRVAAIAFVAALLVGLGGYGLFLGGQKDSCEYFAADLDLAVTAPTEAPDPDDDGMLTYGSCSTIKTKKFDVHVLGWDRHSEHTVAGRISVDSGDRQRLDRLKGIVEEDRDARITPLPALGPGAFLVTRTRPADPEEEEFGGLPDPAAALDLPATAYWVNDRGGSYSLSATRDGATVRQAQRVTTRVAELVNRRPVGSAD